MEKQIENVGKNGISADYFHALAPVKHYLSRVSETLSDDGIPKRWLFLASRTLMQRPIETYLVYFQDYSGLVVNEKNEPLIRNLDSLVGEINSICASPSAQRFLLNPQNSEEVKKITECYDGARKIILS